MAITQQQIKVVKESWRSLRGIRPALIADIFYSKLFSEFPKLRKMFPSEMEAQYNKLIDMLNSIVAQLDSLDALEEDIAAMARRHANYGVKPQHYALVGDALIWTLQKGLGKDWNEEKEEAWKACYQLLADIMIREQSPS